MSVRLPAFVVAEKKESKISNNTKRKENKAYLVSRLHGIVNIALGAKLTAQNRVVRQQSNHLVDVAVGEHHKRL
jgi:hypothetical protein